MPNPSVFDHSRIGLPHRVMLSRKTSLQRADGPLNLTGVQRGIRALVCALACTAAQGAARAAASHSVSQLYEPVSAAAGRSRRPAIARTGRHKLYKSGATGRRGRLENGEGASRRLPAGEQRATRSILLHFTSGLVARGGCGEQSGGTERGLLAGLPRSTAAGARSVRCWPAVALASHRGGSRM